MQGGKQLYLLAFDIHSAKKWRRVNKFIHSFEHDHIQKSVYELFLSESGELYRLKEFLNNQIAEDDDRFVLLPICNNDERKIESYGISIGSIIMRKVIII